MKYRKIVFPIVCDDESCGCPCFDYCKERMYGVDHFSCESVYDEYIDSIVSDIDKVLGELKSARDALIKAYTVFEYE